MIEHGEAVVKTHVAIRQFQVVNSAAGEFRFDKILQVITPESETAAQRKRQVQFLEQFVA